MKMRKVTLDDSIMDFDAWLDQEVLNALTEQVFGVEIISNNFYLDFPKILKKKLGYNNGNKKMKNNNSNNGLGYNDLENKKNDYSLNPDNLKELAA